MKMKWCKNIFFIFYAIIIASILAFILFAISFIGILKFYDAQKVSPYECGFDPFQDTRSRFDVRFYLVAILFIIFDLEIVYLFPWAVSLSQLGLGGFMVMIVFLYILTIGFVYEWMMGALEWE